MAGVVDFPSGVKPSRAVLGMASNTKVSTSIFNQSTLTSGFIGDRWKFTLSFENLDVEIDELSAFMFSLGGMNGRVRLYPWHRAGRPAQGSPVVSSANESGGLLPTNGWRPNQMVLSKGSFFSVNDELKMITEDAITDINGAVTLKFTPWIRRSPKVGDVIKTDKPTGIFRLVEDEVSMNLEPGNGSGSLGFVEAFYV